MKKILLLMGFCCTVSLVNAQAPQNPDHGFQDSQHKTIGVFRDGSIYDVNNKMVGQIVREATKTTIKNGQSQPIAFIVRNDMKNEFKDANNNTIGYTQFDRSTYITTVEDASHKVLGYVKPGGVVENSSHSVIGYGVQIEPVWSAAYYFLAKF